MITLSPQGLDLYDMRAGESCRIVTSPQGVRILTPEGEIETRLTPCGEGAVWLKDQWQDDHWLSLGALRAGAVYEVEARKISKSNEVERVALVLREIVADAD